MIVEILKRITTGVAYAGMLTFIALTIMNFKNIEASVSEVWMHMAASLLLGIYFGLSSFIFQDNGESYLKQTMIHFSMSIVFYFIIAFSVNWIPLTPWSIILSILTFALIYSLYWTAYFLYYKKVEASLNEELRKKN